MSESSRKKGIIATIGGLCTAIAGTTVYQVAVDQLVIRPGQQVLTKFLAGQYEHSLQSGMSMVGSMIQNNPDSIAAAAYDLAQANLPPAATAGRPGRACSPWRTPSTAAPWAPWR
ncbi:MAG: hypothetical protein ACFNLD_06960 [Kingella oralis]